MLLNYHTCKKAVLEIDTQARLVRMRRSLPSLYPVYLLNSANSLNSLLL